MLTDQQLWSPALAHWFPGCMPDQISRLTCRQIMDMYLFITRNTADG